MPAPIFDVLAQTEVAPTGNAQTIYTPPAGRAAVIAGVRVISKWPSVESTAGANIGRISDDGVIYINIDYDSRFEPFPEQDAPTSLTGYSIPSTYFAKSTSSHYGNGIEWYSKSGGSERHHKSASLSVFNATVGDYPVTGLLLSPLVGNHMDIKVPVITNTKPLKITNGIFLSQLSDQKLIAKRPQIMANHRKRCPHLAVTVFGQLVDNT